MNRVNQTIDRLINAQAFGVDKDFVIAAVQCARALRVAMEALETIVVDVANLNVHNPEAEEFQMVAGNAQRKIESIFKGERWGDRRVIRHERRTL